MNKPRGKPFQKGHKLFGDGIVKNMLEKSPARLGKFNSKEHKQKISLSWKNLSEQKKVTRIEKMRQAHLGKKQSKEQIAKRLESRKGYKHSQETIEKIRKANYKENSPTKDKNAYEKQRHLKHLEQKAGRIKSKQCEICGAFGKICFDHNHDTGKFRGWICSRCNITIGLVKDNKELLQAMIKYLEKEDK